MAACFKSELYAKVQKSKVAPEAKLIHHIEWHGSLKKYISAKEKLFLKQDSNDLAIINIDNNYGLSFYEKINKRTIKPIIIKISTKQKLDNTI